MPVAGGIHSESANTSRTRFSEWPPVTHLSKGRHRGHVRVYQAPRLLVFPSVDLTRCRPTIEGSCVKHQRPFVEFTSFFAVGCVHKDPVTYVDKVCWMSLSPHFLASVWGVALAPHMVVSTPVRPSRPRLQTSSIILSRRTGTTGIRESLGLPDSSGVLPGR
ncbi:hypothetical protein VTN02DRAFT_4430 [Thermoascus thermophilus]